MRLKIRTKLTAVSLVSLAIVLAATGIFVQFRFGRDLQRITDDGLRSRADTLLAGIGGSNFAFAGDSGVADSDSSFAQVFGPDGELLDSSEVLGSRALLSAATLSNLTHPTFFESTVALDDETTSVRLLAVPSGEGPIVVVGASQEEAHEASERLIVLLWVGGLAALLLATGISWLLSGAALRPVERMRSDAEALSGSAGLRLAQPGTGDEIDRLALTLNRMLARVEGALERERRFTADASHELRTPLAILKTELELALRRARSVEELRAALTSAYEESERLNALAEDLLTQGGSAGAPNLVELSLASVLANVADALAPLGAPNDVTVSVSAGNETVWADPSRLLRALSNLVDNAIRHSPPGGVVELSGSMTPEGCVIEVADRGAGFPPGFIERAFEPFARSDTARGREGGGVGLGLAITKALIESHGGSVMASNRPGGGALLRATLPIPPHPA